MNQLMVNPNPASDFLSMGGYTPMMFNEGMNPTKSYMMTAANAPAAAPGITPAVTPVVSPVTTTPTQTTLGNFLGVTPGASPAAPGATAPSNGLGFNTGTLSLALGGLQTIGSLWNAWEQNKLARQQFSFQKDFANQNMANQIKSYNTNLASIADLRASGEGWSNAEARKYVAENRLSRNG